MGTVRIFIKADNCRKHLSGQELKDMLSLLQRIDQERKMGIENEKIISAIRTNIRYIICIKLFTDICYYEDKSILHRTIKWK